MNFSLVKISHDSHPPHKFQPTAISTPSISFIMADAISIAETNKIRAALGLKPLPVPGAGPIFKASKDDGSSSEEDLGSTLESRQAQGYDNWNKLQKEADAKAQRDARTEAIKKARDAAKKYSKLEGKGLGEADDITELDTKSWLAQKKKREKKLERERLRKLEQEHAERERQPDYTAEDLAGVKVGHELDDFEEGGDQILTLKDATIEQYEEEGDELENFDMKEREALQERLNSKKKKPVYDPTDADDPEGSTILKHYDETIEGKKRKLFTLDGQGSSAEEREAKRQLVGEKLKAQSISLDTIRDAPISDYAALSETKIKKLKKNKAKTTRKRPVDEEDIFPSDSAGTFPPENNAMDIDSGNAKNITEPPKLDSAATPFVDDEDLQASLALHRRAALKKHNRTKPGDIARRVREEASATPGPDLTNDDGDEDVGLIIDETSEFVANLQRNTEEEKVRQATLIPSEKPSTTDVKDEDMEMNQDDDDDGEVGSSVQREDGTPAPPDITVNGLEEEATLNNGIGSTLTMLSQRGLIKPSANADLNVLHRERQKFLTEKQRREADAERKARIQRERDRTSGKWDRMSARDREEYARWENKQRDQQESRQMTDIFNREYKPDVQLKYVDDFGRSMNHKEAFKHLSHQFHGKGSGKQKTEKHLKKIEDDKKREAMSSLDASQATGMNNAMGATAKKNRQAGVRLA